MPVENTQGGLFFAVEKQQARKVRAGWRGDSFIHLPH